MFFFLVCCGCDTSYIVSVHIQCQTSIYTLSLCRGHSWRMRLAKQETLTPPGHLVSPLVCRGPWMSTVVLYCWCHSDSTSASVILFPPYLIVVDGINQKNKTHRPISSNSHRSATANKAIHCLKWGKKVRIIWSLFPNGRLSLIFWIILLSLVKIRSRVEDVVPSCSRYSSFICWIGIYPEIAP